MEEILAVRQPDGSVAYDCLFKSSVAGEGKSVLRASQALRYDGPEFGWCAQSKTQKCSFCFVTKVRAGMSWALLSDTASVVLSDEQCIVSPEKR